MRKGEVLFESGESWYFVAPAGGSDAHQAIFIFFDYFPNFAFGNDFITCVTE
jgi:hypothetical protein